MNWRIGMAAWLAAGAWATVVDRIAVTVGNDVITETEVMEEMRVTALLNGDPLDFNVAERREAADRLVDQYLIRREMSIGNYPAPPDSEVNAMLREFKKQRFHDEAEYRAALERYGLTEEELKAHLKWQVAALRFTEQRFQAAGLPPATGAEPQPQDGNAERAAPDPGTAPEASRATNTANRPARPGNVDQQMEAWLRQARDRTRVVYMKEAFE